MVKEDTPILAKKHVSSLLIFLLDKDNVHKTDLVSVVHSNTSVDKLVNELKNEGFLLVRREFAGRNTYYISLTEKGKTTAEKLKEAQEVSEGKLTTNENESHVITLSKSDYEKFDQKVRNLSVLSHFNVLDDHIAIRESNYDKKGDERVVFVYVKLNGNGIMRLWCEEDQSFDCWHVKYAWTLPDVQAMVQYQIQHGNAKGFN